MPRNSSGARFSRPAALHRRQRGQRLHQRLRRAARLGDDDEARVGEIEGAERRLQRHRVEVVVEARARARRCCASSAMPGMFQPPSWASVWPPRLEPPMPKKTMVSAPCDEPGERRLGRGEVGGLLGDAQVRQPARCGSPPAARRWRAPSGSSQRASSAVAQPVLADGAVEAAGDRMRVGGGAPCAPAMSLLDGSEA